MARPHRSMDRTAMQKTCSTCKELPAQGRAGLCKPCKKEYNREWYKKNKGKHLLNVSANNRAYREQFDTIVQAAKSVPCKDCRESHPYYVMDFGHLPGSEKSWDVSRMRSYWIDLDVVRAEIAKCEVVCANCHRKRTFNRSHSSTG